MTGMNRRGFLQAGAAIAASTSAAGCLSQISGTSPQSPPVLDDRPDAVYYPTHIEGMKMVGMQSVEWYNIALAYSFPHRFWLVTGRNRRKVEIDNDLLATSIHLMATIWDPETGIVIPSSNLAFEITRGGETIVEKSMWPMLSQNMGLHFGDNVALEGDGTYEVTARIGTVNARTTKAFQNKFNNLVSTTFRFEFSQAERNEISFETLDDRRGEHGAVEPMKMEMMPVAQLPAKEELSGELLGEKTSGDGVFIVTSLAEPPDGIDASGTYFVVSPRTPYNRYPLPFMSVSATITRGSETIFDGDCTPTLDPDLDYHYGAVIDGVQSGDSVSLQIGAPPQIARHEGYETAFLEMNDMEFTVP